MMLFFTAAAADPCGLVLSRREAARQHERRAERDRAAREIAARILARIRRRPA